MDEMLFTVKETAALLKTNVAYVNKLRKAGHIRFMKLGSFKVRKAEIERFLESCEGMDYTDPFKPAPLEGGE
jgi:excisionase family DNA binding protein